MSCSKNIRQGQTSELIKSAVDTILPYSAPRHSSTNIQALVPSVLVVSGESIPARLDSLQTSKILGFEIAHIPILISNKLLKPLGNPPINAPKFFARDYILRLGSDVVWLSNASDVLVAHWAKRNTSSKKRKLGGIQPKKLAKNKANNMTNKYIA